MPPEPVIQTSNLVRRFGDLAALNHLSFEVYRGEVFGFLGHNGAGKTTTIRILVNLLEPSRGSATIFEVDSRSISPRELAEIGYVSENQELPGRLTVAEYLDYLRPFYRRWGHALELSMRREMQLPPARRIRDGQQAGHGGRDLIG